MQELSHLCPRCGVTAANIKKDEFSCRGGLTNQIVYRAMIVGTDVSNASGLVSLIESWVASDRASIMVQSSRLHLDPTCHTELDSLFSQDCINDHVTTTPSSPTKAPINISGHISVGEIAGICIGAAIVILLLLLITVIALKKWRPKVIRR